MSQHVHKLKRHKYKSGNQIFFCVLPDCSYRIDAALALGKRSLCWECENEFLMNEYSVKLTRPHCTNCGKIKVTVEGETRYVRKGTNKLISAIAEEDLTNLRNRLNDAVGVTEEDI